MHKRFNILINVFYGVIFFVAVVFSKLSCAIEGFYIGAGANYNWLDSDFSSNNQITHTTFGPQDVGGGSGEFSGNGAGGQVLAGYTWDFSGICWKYNNCCYNLKYFVSIEGFAEFYDLKGHASWESPQVTTTLNQNLEARLKNGFGAVLKPGIILNDKISLFGMVGYIYSQLDDIVYNTDLTLFNNAGVSNFSDKGLNGLRLGAGVQYFMTENVAAEFSWAIDFYQDFDETNEYITGQPDGSIYYEKVDLSSIRNNQLFLNLVYYL